MFINIRWERGKGGKGLYHTYAGGVPDGLDHTYAGGKRGVEQTKATMCQIGLELVENYRF